MKYQVTALLLFMLGQIIHIDPLWSAEPAPIVLRYADLLRTEQTAGGIFRYLDGNVWITQDTLSIKADHAVYDENAGMLLFNGAVRFLEPHRQIWADQATYYEQDGRALAEGNVRIVQDSITVTCERVVYYEAREEASFYEDVRIHSLQDNAWLTGDQGAYNRAKDYGVIRQNPRLVRRFSEIDSMVVVGRIIEYFFSKKSAVVTDSVQILRNDFNAWGDKLYYYDEQEWARLVGKPLLQREGDTMRADTVDAYFEENKIRRLVLTNNALAISPVDSLLPEPKNRITGRRMEITFNAGELDSIYVTGNAMSTYYVRNATGNNGANIVSGDQIDLWVKGGQIRWIRVEGGTEGVYYPQRLEALAERSDFPPPPKNRIPKP